MLINKIFIILTPFQYKAMDLLFSDKIKSRNCLVICSELCKNKIETYNIEIIPYFFLSRYQIFKNPFKEIVNARKKLNILDKFIKGFKIKYSYINELEIVLGTDKDNFTQLFLNNFKNINKIVAVEEGVGFYRRKSYKDKIIAFFYKKTSRILLGYKINYVACLCIDPRINEIYCRFPKLLPYKNLKVKYHKFKFKNSKFFDTNKERRNILFYSFPEQDGAKVFTFKEEIYKRVYKRFLLEEEIMYIKPHPRENIFEIEEFIKRHPKVKLLNSKIIGEDINFYTYSKIINYSSSVIMYIMQTGFPKKDIITIGIKKEPQISFFKKTNYIQLKNL